MSDGSTSRRRRRKSSHARSPARRPNWRALLLIAFSLGFGTLVVLRTIKLESPSAVRTAAVALESASYEDLPAISAQARGAFAENPLDARAMRILAIVAERQGGNEHTTDLMRTAWRLNRRDDGLDRWLYGQAMRKRQYAEAFVHVDAILRRRPDDDRPAGTLRAFM